MTGFRKPWLSGPSGEPVSGSLIDLDQDSIRKLGEKSLAEIIESHEWDFEFAVVIQPRLRTFYDTNNQGKFDLVLTGGRKGTQVESVLRLKKEGWVKERPGDAKLIDGTLFKNREMRNRFDQIASHSSISDPGVQGIAIPRLDRRTGREPLDSDPGKEALSKHTNVHFT